MKKSRKKSQADKPGKSFSIARRLTLSIILTIVIVSSAVIGLSYLNAVKEAKQDLENKAENTIAYLTGSLAVPIWYMNDHVVKSIGNTIAQENDIIQFEIFDFTRNEAIFSLGKESNVNLITKSGKIFYENHLIGKVHIGFSTSEYKENIRKTLFLSTLAILIVIISVIFVTYFLIKVF